MSGGARMGGGYYGPTETDTAKALIAGGVCMVFHSYNYTLRYNKEGHQVKAPEGELHIYTADRTQFLNPEKAREKIKELEGMVKEGEIYNLVIRIYIPKIKEIPVTELSKLEDILRY